MIATYNETMASGMTIRIYSRFHRYIKFAIVGGMGSIINWSILYVLTEYAGLWYVVSSIIGILIATLNNYIINYHWAFRNERQNNTNMLTGWAKYQLSTGVCSLLYLGVLTMLTEVFGIWYMLSAIIAVFVSSTLNFLVVKKLVWGKKNA